MRDCFWGTEPSPAWLIFPSLILLALTGFVCTHKIQAEEECLSSNVICYECDSRQDPNCVDPFDFSPEATLAPTLTTATEAPLHNTTLSPGVPFAVPPQDRYAESGANNSNSNNNSTIAPVRQAKRLPSTAVCHGCCVKLTSKTLDGAVYVRRTCTTSLHINYFMVGLVCMKESGDRGKMCFCETDYCNGSRSTFPDANLVILLATGALSFLYLHLVGDLSH